MNRRKCFKFQRDVEDSLNVASNIGTGILVFWNKYQIFLVDEQELETETCTASEEDKLDGVLVFNKIYYTDFEIYQLILTEHLLCLDYEGILYAHAIKHTAQQIKHNFQKLEHDILFMECYEDYLFRIQLEKDDLCLKVDKIKPIDSVKLKFYSKRISNNKLLHLLGKIKREECILRICRINESDYDSIKQIFRENSPSCQQFIVIMSLDKLTLYAILVDLESNRNMLDPIKLVTYPSEINSIVIVKENFLNLIISLNSGTVIKQPLNDHFNTPNIVHLNTAIHKFIVMDDKIIYTDGNTMWVLINTFSEPDAKFRQLFVRNVKDFIQINNTGKIICTTYSKLVCTFHVNDESSYLIPIAAIEYYSAEHLFNNMNYLHRIMEEVEKNDEIIKDIQREENYITTLALSNRQDIMNEMIQSCFNVYETYEDILKEGLKLNLTNNFEEYFDKDSFIILIKMSAAMQHNFDNVLANIFTDSKTHITILSEQKIIKTISIKVLDQLNTLNIAFPLNMTNLNITDLSLDIKVVKKIPKVFNSKHNLWTALYCKHITLTPEHFIKTNHSSDKVRLLKDVEDSIQSLLYKTSCRLHGHLFKITKVPESILRWSFNIKLPNSYKECLQNETFYEEHFNSTKAKFLLKEISSEEFLNSRKSISFLAANDKFDIEIISDAFSNPLSSNMVRVTCTNRLLALGIRNFFSNLIYNNFKINQPGLEFMNNFKITSSLKKIEVAVKKCMDERLPFQDFLKIYEEFQIRLCETSV